jgi:hypothetical protein
MKSFPLHTHCSHPETMPDLELDPSTSATSSAAGCVSGVYLLSTVAIDSLFDNTTNGIAIMLVSPRVGPLHSGPARAYSFPQASLQRRGVLNRWNTRITRHHPIVLATDSRVDASGGSAADDAADAAARKRARLQRLAPPPQPVDPVIPASQGAGLLAGSGGPARSREGPLSAYDPFLPAPPEADAAAAAPAEAATRRDAGNSRSSTQADGSFLTSRAGALQRLRRRQAALLAAAARPPTGTAPRFARQPKPPAAGGADAAAAAPEPTAAASNPTTQARMYQYAVAPDGRIVPAAANRQQQSPQQQQRQGGRRQSPVALKAASLAEDIQLLLGTADQEIDAAATGSQSDLGSDLDRLPTAEAFQQLTNPASPQLPSEAPAVTLRVFTYCCPQTDLRRALYAAGLPPGCMEFVATVREADVVLHLQPAPGEKQFAYEEVREEEQALGGRHVCLQAASIGLNPLHPQNPNANPFSPVETNPSPAADPGPRRRRPLPHAEEPPPAGPGQPPGGRAAADGAGAAAGQARRREEAAAARRRRQRGAAAAAAGVAVADFCTFLPLGCTATCIVFVKKAAV